jgi:hypothetical protein
VFLPEIEICDMDLPQAIAIARQVIERLHMNDRISFEAGVWNSDEVDLD